MNREQFNRVEMFQTVSAYLEESKTLFASVKAVNDTLAEMRAGIAAIAAGASKQQTPTTGMTLDKAQVRLGYQEKILELADQLAALADTRHDAPLAAQVECTLSSLDKLPDDELEETGKRVSALTTAHLAALADYGVTPADVMSLDQQTGKFHGAKSAPRTAIAGRAGQTATLPDLINTVTSLLRNRMDKMLTRYRKPHPVFFAGYRSARVIVDRGGGASAAPSAAAAPTTAPTVAA